MIADARPTFSDIEQAHARIQSRIQRTPVLRFDALDELTGAQLSLKCENLQEVGAFKARGALNVVLQLSEDEARRGVVTHSSGNHAAALARAAKIRGITAHIVMPENSMPIKLAAVRALGVEPILCGPTAQEREIQAQAVQAETGATMIHPYDSPRIIAGQGTAALEWTQQQAAPPDIVLIPVGGGGLLSGSLLTLKSLWPTTQVFAAEPAWADDAYRSLQSGQVEMPTRFDTVADGLRTPLGQHTFPIIRDLVDGVLLASEDAIREATRVLVKTTRMLIEPSGALPLAVMLEQKERFRGKRVGLLISGGNLDLFAT